jgi:hypothetical protein
LPGSISTPTISTGSWAIFCSLASAAFPPRPRRKHVAVFRKSGVGKSTLLRNRIAWDIEHGAGVAVEDPHGSLVDEVLETILRHHVSAG